MLVPAGVTHPDGQGCSPVSLTRQSPVLDVLQPVSKATVLDMVRVPGDLLIVGNHLILERRRTNKPGILGVVQQGSVTAPAEWVLMLDTFNLEQLAVRLQLFADVRVAALGVPARPRKHLRSELSGKVHELHKWKALLVSNFKVILTKSGGQVHNSGAVGRSNEVPCYYAPAASSFVCSHAGKVKQRLIPHTQQFGSAVGPDELNARRVVSEYGRQACRSNQVLFPIQFDHRVLDTWVDRQTYVAWQSPRCRRPDERLHARKASACEQELHIDSVFLYLAVTLRHFMHRERGSTAGAVGDNLMPLIQQALFLECLQNVPL